MYRIGVIGCGRISVTYREVFLQMPQTVRVCFCVDKDIQRARAFASHFEGCGYSDRVEDLLKEKLDCVHILTPHFLHAPQAIVCLEAGFHVLLEKPIAIKPEDGQLIIDTAKRCKRELGVISQNRYIPGIQAAKRALEDGTMGKICGAYSVLNWWRPPSYYQCDWKGKWATEGGGVVTDQAIHSLDLVRYLMACPVISVKGHIDRRILTSIEVEDVADAAIVYQNGAVHSFFACNYYANNADIRIEFQCENGRFALEEKNYVSFHMNDGRSWKVAPSNCVNGGESYWGANHQTQIEDFYDCLSRNVPVPVDPQEALKTLELVQAIYQSSRENRKIDFSA